jgi:hypothetical protein
MGPVSHERAKGWFIRNIGKLDARDARIRPMEFNNLLLGCDPVAYIGPGDTPIRLRSAKKNGGVGSPVIHAFRSGSQAFQMFIEEIIQGQINARREPDDPLGAVTDVHEYLMLNNHMLQLDLFYSDFAGHVYMSPCIAAWSLTKGIVEMKPEPNRNGRARRRVIAYSASGK